MSRFGSKNLQEIKLNVPANTVKSKTSIWRQFTKFCEERRYELNDSTPVAQLNNILKDWACNMKKEDGNEYKQYTVKCMWNSTAKSLQELFFTKYNIQIDPFEGIEFNSARDARNTKRRTLQKLAKLKAQKSNVESKPSTSAASNEEFLVENSSDFPIEHVDVGSTSCGKITHPDLNFLPKSDYPLSVTGKKTKRFASRTPSRSKRARLARTKNLKKYTDLNDLPIEQVDVGSTSFEETTDPDLDLLPESDEPSLPKHKRNKDMKIYCRLCLNPSNKNQMVCFGDFHDINYPSRSEQFKRNKILQTEMYLRMIRTVMPNFNHDLVYNPIMCNVCSTRLQMASDFVEQCMATQHLIQQYKDRYCPAEKLVSCEDVVYNRCLLLPLPQNNQAVPSNVKKRKIDKSVPQLVEQQQQQTESVSFHEDFQTLENVNVKTEQFEEMENELKYEITPEEACTIKQEFVEEETMIKSEITLPVDTVVKNEPCSTEISDYNIVATEQTSIKQFSNIDIPNIYNTNYLVGVPHVPAQFCHSTLPAQYCTPNQPVTSETFVSLIKPVTTQSVASNNADLSLNFQNNQNR